MKTLIGIVTFGNLAFTKLAVRGIRETAKKPVDVLIIAGKPDDMETREWLRSNAARDICRIVHNDNKGFPASINDLYDAAWTGDVLWSLGGGSHGDYDNLIVMGNDVIPYPGAIDAMIEAAETYEWVCAGQFDVRSLCDRYPDARKFFKGGKYEFSDFDARPWELHREVREPHASPGCLSDVRNLCLFRKSVFEKIGYADVSFWPNGYFEDNDYCRRAVLADVKACALDHAAYFHFWSRTIHQGEARNNGRYFEANRAFYIRKWGGEVGHEKWKLPFDGEAGVLPCTLKIRDRDAEPQLVQMWRGA